MQLGWRIPWGLALVCVMGMSAGMSTLVSAQAPDGLSHDGLSHPSFYLIKLGLEEEQVRSADKKAGGA